MKHNIQPGVVLVQVCGESMLVATRLARGKCPYVKQMNPTGAFFWSLLEQGMDAEEMILAASEAYGVPPERVRPGLMQFLEELRKNGYLLEEGAQ
ncbi:MAG: PqqD family protein [Candidatus Faecousia sp.]|nr:PqqD family protein [Bacillota bacterium]MDY4218902.1 PqqD family protein [Candidatus Faecousia sp.]